MKLTVFISLLTCLVLSTISFSQVTEFEVKWSKVDSLEKKGLYRMALNEVNSIFSLGTKNENHNQVIKSVLYELKYNAYLEEDDYVLGISRLDSLILTAPSPSKEILHSLTAEVYWGYYNSNTWKFQDRTNVLEVDLKDIRTWDLKRIAKKVRNHYLLSLGNSNESKLAPIQNFQEIASHTTTKETSLMRPTLFDFLAHRALDFFKSNDFHVPGPAETFVIQDARFIGANTSFMNAAKIATADSLNTDFYAIRILYELTKFHQANHNENALFAIELERLKYVSTAGAIKNGSDLYYDGLERLAQSYQNKPFSSEAWYEMAVVHSQKAGTYSFKGDTTQRWENKVAIEICKKTINQYPDSHGARQCAALQNVIGQKVLNVRGESAISTNEKSLFYLQYKNVDKLYYKVIPYDYKKFNAGKHYSQNIAKDFGKVKAVESGNIDLTDPGDYQNHSTEMLMPELENGFYFLIVSSSETFSTEQQAYTYLPFWVSNITYQTRSQQGDPTVLVTDRTSGKALVGAKTSVTYEKYNYALRVYEHRTLGNYTTDEEGQFSFKPNKDYYNYFIKVSHNNEVYSPSDRMYAYNYNRGINTRNVTQLFTDRSIYRPGQTVHFKGIIMTYTGEKRELKTNYSTTVYFYDVNSQEIGKQEVKTNEFGSFQGEFAAPFGVLTGQMRIQESNHTKYFRVEEYKRPKFTAEFNPVEGEFQLNDEINVTGFAQAFAGNYIDGAEVKYRVTRTTSYGNSWYWWYWRPIEEPKEVLNGETTTDDNGEFKIDFTAIPDLTKSPKNLPQFTYTLTADITDINGETHATSTRVIVGYQSLVLGNNFQAEQNGDNPFFIRMSTNNLNGQPIDATGTIKISKLDAPDKVLYNRYWEQPDYPSLTEKEFKAIFPHKVYADENNLQKWKVDKQVFKTNFNTSKSDSIAIPNYKNWAPGTYKYESVANDKNGIEVKDVAFFTLFKPSSKTPANNQVLWIKELKSLAEPGEKVSILLGSKEKDLTVFFDVEIKNKIVESGSFVMSNEQRQFDYDVEEIHRGNFTVHFSTVQKNRKHGRSVTFTVPYTNKRLDLEFSVFRDKLLPGADEEWTMTIKNAKGEKEMAELLATLYDASLDELYTPNSFYMNVYNSYYGNQMWGSGIGMTAAYGSNIHSNWNNYVYAPNRYFPVLNYHGYNTYYYGYYNRYKDGGLYDMDANNAVYLEESEVMMDDVETPMVSFSTGSDMKNKKEQSRNARGDNSIAADQQALGGASMPGADSGGTLLMPLEGQ
ncbi:MAG: hypothetical protein ACI857_001312, partial [Arenicella sp.]